MRVVIIGNSGSGKTTLARRLAEDRGVVHLDLDEIAWEPGRTRAPRDSAIVREELAEFVRKQWAWIVEGCYGELIEEVLPSADELIFLNPGLDACLAHNRGRPWEPHKYESKVEQDAMLPQLQAWVTDYYTREDAWSFTCHRRIFETFAGRKREICTAEVLDEV